MEKKDKRDVILEAALEIVAEHGFHGAPMAMIAERAGVGAGTIYRYFECKDSLIREIYKALEERFQKAVMQGYPEKGSVRERYIHIGVVLVKYLIKAPLELRFVEQFHNSPYGAERRREKIFGKGGKDTVTQVFLDAQEQRVVKELDLPVLFALTFGPLVYACRDHIVGFINLDDRLILQIVEACWDAIRRNPGQSHE